MQQCFFKRARGFKRAYGAQARVRECGIYVLIFGLVLQGIAVILEEGEALLAGTPSPQGR